MKNCLFKYKSHLATAFIGLCLRGVLISLKKLIRTRKVSMIR